jgi:hypothetical protein
MEDDTTTFYEVHRLPWPLTEGETDLVQEWIYHIDAAGQVLPGKWTDEQRAALQALIDLRGPEARKPGRGNSLTEISFDSPEAQLSHAVALAMLSPEERQAYHARQEQEKRIEHARALIREAHKPVSIANFDIGPIDEQGDGTGLVEVTEPGPNWTNRYTLYILALSENTDEIRILQAYTPYGENCINRSFQAEVYAYPDESGQHNDFIGHLLYQWAIECPDWLPKNDKPIDYSQSFIVDDLS